MHERKAKRVGEQAGIHTACADCVVGELNFINTKLSAILRMAAEENKV